jgi:hypothetical protein
MEATSHPASTSRSSGPRSGLLSELHDQSRRAALGEPREDLRSGAERGGHQNEFLVQRMVELGIQQRVATGAGGGIGNADRVALGGQEVREPAAHAARPADDQRAMPAARSLRGHPRLLLAGERGVDEQAHDGLGQGGRQAQLAGAAARALDDGLLALEVPRGLAGGELVAGNLLHDALALGHQRHEPLVDAAQSGTEIIEVHVGAAYLR